MLVKIAIKDHQGNKTISKDVNKDENIRKVLVF